MKILIIFGCGVIEIKKKDYDGKSCEKYADYIIVTDDNPRSEDPKKITSQIKDVLNRKIILKLLTKEKLL